MNLNISQALIENLPKIKEACVGKLFGTSQGDNLFILSLQLDIENGLELGDSLPANVECCGIFHNVDASNQSLLNKYKEVIVTDHRVCVLYQPESGQINCEIEKNGKLERCNYEIISENDIYNQFLNIRIKGEMLLKSELTENAVVDSFLEIQKSLSLGSIAFGLTKSNIFLLDPELENSVVGIDGDISVGEICEDSNNFNEESSRKKKIQRSNPRILDLDILKPVTKLAKNGLIKEHAPVCILDKNQLTVLNMKIQIDALAMVPIQTKVDDLYDILRKSVNRYLRLFESTILEQIRINELGGLALETYHFLPPRCGYFITLLYSKSKTDESLKSYRQLLHKQLLLDFLSPVFRRANKYSFESNPNRPLINPHEGIKSTDNGGVTALVKGKYEYYHYCQNKMDDNGWGCAYRSLQTLASWFKLQGYVDKDVPSFLEIQKCLVDIKDKPSSFVGSRQWIGSTEVNFVLNTLFGIENKILYVSSGAEMASKGHELLNHFQNHGSPVMIGGGVLAHTILGVDYNQRTGSIRFLILDPHYTGSEDLHVIQSKGWCGWKTVDFWNKTSYYNMCLPQVPRDI